jgi:hypothetical protein
MSTEPKALPPHGDRRRYQLGCRCVPCKAANAAYRRERYALTNGEANPVVPQSAAVNLRFDPETLGKIDTFAATEAISRSTAVRKLIAFGLQRARRQKKVAA